jgi:phosphoglycolate phosphatase
VENKAMKKAVLFDMDGTLMYTLEDLTDSINYALELNGYPIREVSEVKSFVGNGIKKLMERALPESSVESEVDKCYKLMIDYYHLHAMDKSRPYDNAVEVVLELNEKDIKVGIVTNKVQKAAEDISDKFFGNNVEVVVGVKKFRKLKPDAEPINIALKKLNIKKEEAIFVGDSEVDLLTAKNAGVDFIGAAWGFRGEEALIKNGAKVVIKEIEDLFKVL